MNCIIPGANVKIVSRVIQALSKIGDELYLTAKSDCLSFRSVNMNITAYCAVNFYESFFSSYTIEDNSEEGVDCKIPMKALLGVFKNYTTRDKKPEVCKIELDSDADKIVFKIKYKNDIVVVRSLYLVDGKVVEISHKLDNAANQIVASAQLFSQVLTNFYMGDEDIALEITPNKALIRNYIAGSTNAIKGIRSQLTLNSGEFINFQVEQDTCVTFSLKTFRAAIHFAELFNLNVTLNFDTTGKPCLLVIKSTTFDINFLIATLKADDLLQSTLSSTCVSTRKEVKRANNTVQNQQELEHINWGNDVRPQPNLSRKKSFADIMSEVCTNVSNNNRPSESHKLDDHEDFVSPDSPKSKRVKSIFGRCFESTFHNSMMDLGEVLAPDSDPESE